MENRIPVNPDRRDPGLIRKKSEIGLSNVDNISFSQAASAIADETKYLSNEKKIFTIVDKTSLDDLYLGLIITRNKSAHAYFTASVYTKDSDEELSTFSVDFSYEFGEIKSSVSAIINISNSNKYLSEESLVFCEDRTEGNEKLLILLHKPQHVELDFERLGVGLVEWSPDTEILDCSKNYSNKINGGGNILTEYNLKYSSSSLIPSYSEGLVTFDKDGRKNLILDNNLSQEDIEYGDFPTINDVPFIGKKGIKYNGVDFGRHITITAKHKKKDLENCGYHDWNVLYNQRKSNLLLDSDEGKMINRDSSNMINDNTGDGYGVCRLSKYSNNSNNLSEWLTDLGEDTDVLTVGLLKTYLKLINTDSSLKLNRLYLIDSSKSYNYLDNSFHSNEYIEVRSLDTINDSLITIDKNDIKSDSDWLKVVNLIENSTNKSYRIIFRVQENNGDERIGTLIITNSEGDSLKIKVIQDKFECSFGISENNNEILDTTINLPQYDSSNISDGEYIFYTVKEISTGSTEPYYPSEIMISSSSNWIQAVLEDDEEVLNKKKITFYIEENTFPYNRTGYIYITLDGPNNSLEKLKTYTLIITQKGPEGFLEITDYN